MQVTTAPARPPHARAIPAGVPEAPLAGRAMRAGPLARGVALLALGLAVSGCVYEMPIQQGNHLDEKAISQVHAGMTRSQVRYLLGTPMVPNAFDHDRWEYAYYLKVRQLKVERRGHVTVWFKDDLVDRVASDVNGDHPEPVSSKPVTAPGA